MTVIASKPPSISTIIYLSIALAQSVGLQKEGIRRGFYYENERWVDHVIYVALPANIGLSEKPPAILTDEN